MYIPFKTCSVCKEERGLIYFNKCSRVKSGIRASCRDCDSEYKKAYTDKKNAEKGIKTKREVYSTEEKLRRKRLAANKYYKNNKEKAATSSSKWKKNNSGKVTAYTMARIANKLKATPRWVNTEKIIAKYEFARMMEKYMDQKYHVDHIIPLKGKNVCGLHVEDNLQILLATDNMSKGNRF